jgi:hypothetical protein
METSNVYKIAVVVVIALISSLVFYATTSSLKKLQVKIISYYPFGHFFPKSGSWSILYFLISILFLGALIYLLAKGGFYLNPA